jgi:hypothetical protein
MIALPGNRGYFEIRMQEGRKGARSALGKGANNSLVVYFYQPDGRTEMTPAPTEVSVKLGTGSNSQVIPLATQSGSGGAGGNSFASLPGHFPSGFRGELSAKINGEDVATTFSIR